MLVKDYLAFLDAYKKGQLEFYLKQYQTTIHTTDVSSESKKEFLGLLEDDLTLAQIQTVLEDPSLTPTIILTKTLAYFAKKSSTAIDYLSFLSEQETNNLKDASTLGLELFDEQLYLPILSYLLKNQETEAATKELLRGVQIKNLSTFLGAIYEKSLQELQSLEKTVQQKEYQAVISFRYLDVYHDFERDFSYSKIPVLEKLKLLNQLSSSMGRSFLYQLNLLAYELEIDISKENLYYQYQDILQHLKNPLPSFYVLAPTLQYQLEKELGASMSPLTIKQQVALLKELDEISYPVESSQILRILPEKELPSDVMQIIINEYQKARHDTFSFSLSSFTANMKQKYIEHPILKDFSQTMFYQAHLSFAKMNEQQKKLLCCAKTYQQSEVGKTKLYQKRLQPYLEKEQKALQLEEAIYHQSVEEKYMPILKTLQQCDNYTLSSFIKENISLEDQEKFRALCQFYKEKDPTFFANSIDREDAIEKNQKRLIQATNEFLSTTPLKELTGANIVRYFEKMKSEEFPYNRHQYMGLASETIRSRLVTQAKFQIPMLLEQLEHQTSLLSYIATQDFFVKQVYDMLDLAEDRYLFDKTLLSRITKALNEEEKKQRELALQQELKEKQEQTKKTAYTLMKKFLTSDCYGLMDFYTEVAKEYHINEEKTRALLTSVCQADPALQKAYDEKKVQMKEKQKERRNQRLQEKKKNNPKLTDDIQLQIPIRLFSGSDIALERLCKTYQLDYDYYLFLKQKYKENKNDEALLPLLQKASQELAPVIQTVTYVVAKRMVHCHKTGEPYPLLTHFERFGFPVSEFAKIGNQLGFKNTPVLEKYLRLHEPVFQYVSYQHANQLQTAGYSAGTSFLVDKTEIPYTKKQMTEAIAYLQINKIPFYKGTIAEALGQVKQQEKVKLHTFTCSKNKD